MNLKDRIKTLCKENRITVNKLEKTLGFGTGYVSKLENSTPNTTKIKLIADYFHVSIEYLLGSENYKHDSDTNTWIYEIPKEDSVLIEKVMLDSDMSKRLIAYAKKLVELNEMENI